MQERILDVTVFNVSHTSGLYPVATIAYTLCPVHAHFAVATWNVRDDAYSQTEGNNQALRRLVDSFYADTMPPFVGEANLVPSSSRSVEERILMRIVQTHKAWPTRLVAGARARLQQVHARRKQEARSTRDSRRADIFKAAYGSADFKDVRDSISDLLGGTRTGRFTGKPNEVPYAGKGTSAGTVPDYAMRMPADYSEGLVDTDKVTWAVMLQITDHPGSRINGVALTAKEIAGIASRGFAAYQPGAVLVEQVSATRATGKEGINGQGGRTTETDKTTKG